jgi:hypothetical protein
VTSEEAQTATRFLERLEAAVKTGDWEGVYPLLAQDIEWVMPKRTLNGVDEIRDDLTWASPPERLDIEFEVSDLEDLGGGRMAVEVRQVYRMKDTGDFAYHRIRRIELIVSGDQVCRYEMRIVG